MEMIKNQWRRRRSEVVCLAVVMVAAYAIGVLFFSAMSADADTGIALPMGTLLAGILGAVVHVICNCWSMANEFNLAVSMGVTRKRFVSAYLLFSLLELLFMLLAAAAMLGMESLLYGVHPSNVPLAPLYLLLALLGILSVETFMGALLLRFGMKVFWIFWLLPWLILSFGLSRAEHWAIFVSGAMLSAIAAVVCVALLFASWQLLKRQQVTA